MKLNNHGWGLNQMLMYMAILVIALLCAIYFIVQLSEDLGDVFRNSVVGNVTYATIEKNIENAANSYIQKYYNEEIGTGTITITTTNLINYNLLKEIDLKISNSSDSCNGYALVTKDNGKLNINSFIKCGYYESDGFQTWRIGD